MEIINLKLTKEEKDYLTIEMNTLLRSYKRNYNGQMYDNEHMGSAFNKVFKALTGKDHEQYLKVSS